MTTTDTTTDTQEATQEPQEQPNTTQDAPETTPTHEKPATDPTDTPDQDTPDTRHKPNEAARYRTRLRQTEQALEEAKQAHADELAALNDRLDALTRAAIARELTTMQPEGFFRLTPDTSDLLNDDGTVNPRAVQAAEEQALHDIGAVTRRRDPAVGREHVNPPRTGGAGSWAQALREAAGNLD